jgi:hypothetical protein
MAFIQKEMKKILSNQNLNNDEKEKQLTELAKKVGANGLYYVGGQYLPCYGDLLVDRINDALRTKSAVLGSIASIVSAVTALVSAIAAWRPVISR